MLQKSWAIYTIKPMNAFPGFDTGSKRTEIAKFQMASRLLLGAIFLLCAKILPAYPRDRELPTVHFHQFQMEAWRNKSSATLNNEQMMDLVFSSLPDEINVYPSEGYYYFNFIANKSDMRGNIRFDNALIKNGSLAFMLYRRRADGEDKDLFYIELKESPLFYLKQISDKKFNLFYKGKFSIVNLHEQDTLSNAKKDKSEYIFGELIDDSGEEFYLVFNNESKSLYYVWNQQDGISERLDDSPWARIKIGYRTGFAYMKDPLGRYILIGVNNTQIQQNSHFDGPFDQLPDRKIDFARLRAAIVKSDPKFGALLEKDSITLEGSPEKRYAILSYIAYIDLKEFKPLRRCERITQLKTFMSCIDHAIKRAH